MNRPELPSNKEILNDIIWCFENALKKLCELPEYTDERQGGYAVLMNASTGDIIACIRVGLPTPGKEDKYMAFAIEKAKRLFNSRKQDGTIVSSWQTRNPDADQYGGAIYGVGWIASFSGLSPDTADDAVSAAALAQLEENPLPREQALAIGAISDNPFMEPLIKIVLQ